VSEAGGGKMSARLGRISAVYDSRVNEPAVSRTVPPIVACSAKLQKRVSPLRARWKWRRKGLKGLNPAMEMASCRKRRTREASPPMGERFFFRNRGVPGLGSCEDAKNGA